MLALLMTAAPSLSSAPVAFSARGGLEVAADAARSWAPDARLVYLENDELVSASGTANRWGYLFYSSSRNKSRGYSVENSKILEASDLGFDLEAPPIADGWIDSQEAFAVAQKKHGLEYCAENSGRLATMLLVRGAFHEKKPNATTWTLVYTSSTAPTLFVVVDAAAGKVVKIWKG
jgi:hypothetical protein